MDKLKIVQFIVQVARVRGPQTVPFIVQVARVRGTQTVLLIVQGTRIRLTSDYAITFSSGNPRLQLTQMS